MRVVYGRNVNETYAIGVNALAHEHEIQDSRVGEVLVMPTPVTTVYQYPEERVLFNAKRDANPFFHLMEGLWMLAGRNDVEWITFFNSKFDQFSDNGETFNAAYGYRWRQQFKRDQLSELIAMLENEPNTRRAVISMWDPYADFNKEGKDFPCNLNIAFRIRDKKLTMTVFNRSNDIIWGAYGANAVHMSMLQEYIARSLNIEMGAYTQVSNDYHAYTNVLDKIGIPDPHPMDPYDMGDVNPFPMLTGSLMRWEKRLSSFMEDSSIYIRLGYKQSYKFDNGFIEEPFFAEIVIPMLRAWGCYKHKDHARAIDIVTNSMPNNCDWKVACRAWLVRKAERYATRNSQKRLKSQKVAHDN